MGAGIKKVFPSFQPLLPGTYPQQQVAGGRMRTISTCPSQKDSPRKWDLWEAEAMCVSLYWFEMAFPSCWVGRGEGGTHSWFKCHSLSIFLLSFSKKALNICFLTWRMPLRAFSETLIVFNVTQFARDSSAQLLMLSCQKWESPVISTYIFYNFLFCVT